MDVVEERGWHAFGQQPGELVTATPRPRCRWWRVRDGSIQFRQERLVESAIVVEQRVHDAVVVRLLPEDASKILTVLVERLRTQRLALHFSPGGGGQLAH